MHQFFIENPRAVIFLFFFGFNVIGISSFKPENCVYNNIRIVMTLVKLPPAILSIKFHLTTES